MTITGSIFLRTDTGLVELRESAYDSEAILQQLLADYPNLIPGDQIDAVAPCRLLLVRREMEVPGAEDGAGRWSIDHLFLDQDGVPTLVEVKRSTDTRIRREVVGQMLDYAANAVAYWPLERIRAAFESTCAAAGDDPDASLRDFVSDEDAYERFWPAVQTNLQAGRIRLVFVADVIPQELRRVVEFLNQQMNPAEVLALEVKQYVGQALQTLVPRILGQTSAAQQRKGASKPGRHWDEAAFFEALASDLTEAEIHVARRLYEWALGHGLRLWWGKGQSVGSFFPMLDLHSVEYYTFAVNTKGKLNLELRRMTDRPALPNHDVARGLLERLRTIPGMDIPEDRLTGVPSFDLKVLSEPSALRTFLETFDTYIDHVQAHRLDDEA